MHQIAFAVEDCAAHLKAREALKDTDYQITPVINRQYFYAFISGRPAKFCSKS